MYRRPKRGRGGYEPKKKHCDGGDDDGDDDDKMNDNAEETKVQEMVGRV